MQRVKNIFIIIGCIILTITFIKMCLLYEQDVEFEIDFQEQEDIDSFYAIEPESISRGLSFDMKYVYLDPTAFHNHEESANLLDAMAIEVVMKNNRPLDLKRIRIYNQCGRLLDISYGNFKIRKIDVRKDLLFIPLSEEYQRLGYLASPISSMWYIISYNNFSPDLTHLRINFDVKESNFQLFYRTDSNYVVYDENKRLESTRKIKETCIGNSSCNYYEKRQVGYYFGILFHKNFDQWYQEIKEFMAQTEDLEDYHLEITFNNPCTREKEKSLQEKLDVNEEQLQKCLEIMDILQYQCEFYP